MITLFDIVDAASADLKLGILVLHKSMKVHPKFKVYKIFGYDLYRVVDKNKTLISSFSNSVNAPSEDIDRAWAESDKLYLKRLIKWFTSTEYKLMIDGI